MIPWEASAHNTSGPDGACGVSRVFTVTVSETGSDVQPSAVVSVTVTVPVPGVAPQFTVTDAVPCPAANVPFDMVQL